MDCMVFNAVSDTFKIFGLFKTRVLNSWSMGDFAFIAVEINLSKSLKSS